MCQPLCFFFYHVHIRAFCYASSAHPACLAACCSSTATAHLSPMLGPIEVEGDGAEGDATLDAGSTLCVSFFGADGTVSRVNTLSWVWFNLCRGPWSLAKISSANLACWVTVAETRQAEEIVILFFFSKFNFFLLHLILHSCFTPELWRPLPFVRCP